MSTVSYSGPFYTVFKHPVKPGRPLVVDEKSQVTVISDPQYEEPIPLNGDDLRGRPPSDTVPMAAYKTQPAQLHGFTDTAYPAFNAQAFQPQQAENTTSQLSNIAFSTTATTAGQYLSPSSSPSSSPVNIVSCGPTEGTAGTRVELKVSSQYDLMAMSPPAPYVWLSFGSQKCHAEVVKETVSQDGLTYIVSAEAPQFMVTNCASPADVPLTVVIENTAAEELARVPVARSFTYHDASNAVGTSVPASSMDATTADSNAPSAPEGMTRKSPPQSPGHIEGHNDSTPQLTVRTSVTNSPNQTQSHLESNTNNAFAYPATGVDPATAAAAAQQAQHVQTNFAAAAAATSYNEDNGNMLGAYRSASFSDGFSRAAAPPALRTTGGAPSWTTPSYGGIGHHQGTHHVQHAHDRYSMGRSHSVAHVHSIAGITRQPPSAPLPALSNGSAPQLIRTSTIQSNSPGSVSSMGGSGGYGGGHWSGYPAKAVLSILGNLDSMAQDWTPEEWNNRRRIVLFRKKQNGCHLETTFRPVPINERPPNSICISCIYWAEKQECFVTSVDTINLLEQLVAAPARFSVEEKNRIRRNLEGFKPFTVSKAKAESEEFFKLIMAFGAPKPRTIEKDVKVFPWKILGQALKKIISKYSASPFMLPNSTAGPSPAQGSNGSSGPSIQGHHLLTPVTMNPSYPVLPPTPGSLSTGTDGASTVGYVNMPNGTTGADTLASPRSLSGASWVSYAGNASSGRALSPGSATAKPQSPSSASLRLGALSSAYDARSTAGTTTPSAHAYGHHQQHPAHSFNAPLSLPTSSGAAVGSATGPTLGASAHAHRWDSYGVSSGAAASSYASNHHHHSQQPQQQQHSHHGHLYSNGYGDSVQRS